MAKARKLIESTGTYGAALVVIYPVFGVLALAALAFHFGH